MLSSKTSVVWPLTSKPTAWALLLEPTDITLASLTVCNLWYCCSLHFKSLKVEIQSVFYTNVCSVTQIDWPPLKCQHFRTYRLYVKFIITIKLSCSSIYINPSLLFITTFFENSCKYKKMARLQISFMVNAASQSGNTFGPNNFIPNQIFNDCSRGMTVQKALWLSYTYQTFP